MYNTILKYALNIIVRYRKTTSIHFDINLKVLCFMYLCTFIFYIFMYLLLTVKIKPM